MRLTPASHTAPASTGSCDGADGKGKKRFLMSEKNVEPSPCSAGSIATAAERGLGSTKSALPSSFCSSFSFRGALGNCQRPGGVGSRNVRGMDAAAQAPGDGFGVANPPPTPATALLYATRRNLRRRRRLCRAQADRQAANNHTRAPAAPTATTPSTVLRLQRRIAGQFRTAFQRASVGCHDGSLRWRSSSISTPIGIRRAVALPTASAYGAAPWLRNTSTSG